MKRPFPLAVSIVALCAFGGLVIFGIMTWRSTSIDRLEPADAAQRLEAVRQRFGRAAPVLQLGADGTVISRRPPNERPDAVISKIIVVTYDASTQRLTETRIPFWFFRIKAPAAEYAFGGTGLDFRRLGLTAADLRGYGPALIVDHTTGAARRVVVWTE